MQYPLPYTDEVETVPIHEQEDIDELIGVLAQILRQTAKSAGERRRDVHVKSNGCALGELDVFPLGETLAQGLFSQPGKHPAIVRFSNSSPIPQADAVPDGRGLAIQVYEVNGDKISPSDGPIQNFVMVNHPTFIVSNVKDYLAIELARLEPRSLRRAVRLLTQNQLSPISWRWNVLSAFASIAAQPPSLPTSYTYYSMVPFRFGEYIAKYRVTPQSPRPSWLPTTARSLSRSDAMRRALAKSLRVQNFVMNFEVQLRTSDRTMPIEDAAVNWPQNESPYVPVAQLVLPRQDISAPLVETINAVSFSVWHGLLDHRPLGGINRLRRRVYETSSLWRQATGFQWDAYRS